MGAVEPYAGVKGRVSETGSRTADRRPGPKLGDVLCSRPVARADIHAIRVLPADARIIAIRDEDAMKRAGDLARELAADGWYTCDHTHFVRIASYRTQVEQSVPGAISSGHPSSERTLGCARRPIRGPEAAFPTYPGWLGRLLTHPVKGREHYEQLMQTPDATPIVPELRTLGRCPARWQPVIHRCC
jgi:hypothetical protein